MKISILLPYKENYSHDYPGAVSLFVASMIKISKFKKTTKVFGSTDYKSYLSKNYENISLKKGIFASQTKQYINNFIKTQNDNVDLIEIHNRPNYALQLEKLNKKIFLYFHNDPNTMLGSKTENEKIKLIDLCTKIIFNSYWSKNQFLTDLPNKYKKSQKLIVIHQSINKKKIDLSKKKKLISFVGKLNSAKGYDIFGKAIIKILNKYPDWKANVIGDEPREEFNFTHNNLNILGFKNHKDVLLNFEKSSIAVVCSRWNEPFGRTSLEASSRGCGVIISNRGGLPETITNGIILKNLSVNSLFKEIENLIVNQNLLKKLQKDSINNFVLTNDHISNKIDECRIESLNLHVNNLKLKNLNNLKILHVTNFNERHNGRLFYNSGRRINNGFIRLNHSVLELSDRDIVSYSRNLNDFKGSKKLNEKLLDIISNYIPDLIVFGHADLIDNETINFIKKNYPNTKLCQWFLDRMDGEWVKNKDRFIKKIELMDANFCTTDPKALNFSKWDNVYYIPNCVDQSLENLEIYNNNYFKSDVFFAMSHGVHRGQLKKGKKDNREIFLNQLIKKNQNIKFDVYGMNNIQPVWSDKFLECLSKSSMALNLSRGKPVKYYSSDRIAQLIGNGLLTFVDEKTYLSDFFSNKEVVFYKDLNDLSYKMNKYKKDKKNRKKIARSGRKFYFKYFNSTLVADYIINKTLDLKSSQSFIWEK